jgi:hypothetical protein
MDMMAMASGILAMQAGNMQMQVATAIMKSNMDADKSAVQTLLGAAQQNIGSLANVGTGIGSNVNITA